MQKPGVITTVQVLLWIGVGASVLITCIGLGIMSEASKLGLGGTLTFSLVISVAGAVLNAVVAVNLGQRRNWARITGIVVSSITVALNAITLVSGSAVQSNAATTVINSLLQCIVIGCLASQDAKRWCDR